MIISTPVFYRAAVVKPGHRKEEDCLIRLEIPVRIDEGTPPLAVSLEDNMGYWGEVSKDTAPAHVFRGPATWYDRDGSLLGEFHQVQPANKERNYGIADLQRDLESVRYLPGLNPLTRTGEAYPLFSPRAMTATPDGMEVNPSGSDLPVYDESTAFRTMRPAYEGIRDEAMAHAGMTARSMMVHRETGQLLVPSNGPVLLANTRPMRFVAHTRPKFHELSEAYGALDLDEATVRHAEIFDGLPPVPPTQTLTVLRPAAVTWDARSSAIVEMAGRLGMNPGLHAGIGFSRTFFGLDQGRTDQAAVSRFNGPATSRADLYGDFQDARSPSTRTVQVAYDIVSEMHELQKLAACDFSGRLSYAMVQPGAVRDVAHALARAGMIPCLGQNVRNREERLEYAALTR